MAYDPTTGSAGTVNWNIYLKQMWHDGRIANLAARENTFLSLVPKKEDFFGDSKYVNVDYGTTQGASATFSTSQNNAKVSSGVRFQVYRKSDFGNHYVDNELIEASQNDVGALLQTVDHQLEMKMKEMKNRYGFNIINGAGGTRGQLNAAPTVGTPDTIVLKVIRNVRRFEVGMVLKAGSTDGTTATTFRSTPSTATITGIDRKTGTLSFAANTFSGTNWAANDYLSVEGDIDSSTFLGKVISGVGSWIVDPSTIISTDSFQGVNRYPDKERLGGVYLDGSSMTLENGIETISALIAEVGGATDIALMSPRVFQKLSISLGTKRVYGQVNGSGDSASVGFRSIEIAGQKGTINCVSDFNMPDDRIYPLQLDTWTFHTLNKCPRIQVTGDGLQSLRVSNADTTEFRMVGRGQLYCRAPGWNGYLKIA